MRAGGCCRDGRTARDALIRTLEAAQRDLPSWYARIPKVRVDDAPFSTSTIASNPRAKDARPYRVETIAAFRYAQTAPRSTENATPPR